MRGLLDCRKQQGKATTLAALLDEALLALLERERKDATESADHARRKRDKLRKALRSVEDGWEREQRLLGYHCDQAVEGLMAGYSAERRWRRAVGMQRPDERCIVPKKKRSDERNRAQAEWKTRVVTQVFYIDQVLWDEVMREIESLRMESNRRWPGLYLRGLPDGYWIWTALNGLVELARKEAKGTVPKVRGESHSTGRLPRTAASAR
jgi:hypothetical protein